MSAQPQPSAPSAFEQRCSVVFADDDPLVREYLGLALQQAYDYAGAATDAEEAIAIVAARHPDVVILDVNMPRGGARRATREIRRCSERTAIVILSSDELREEVVELLELGAVTYLRKGVDTQTLLATLEHAIEAHRSGLATAADRQPPREHRGTALPGEQTTGPRRPGNTDGVFEPAALVELAGREQACKLITIFIEDLADGEAQLARAAAAADLQAAGQLAHKLRGAAATVGAPLVVELCEALEHTTAAGDCGRSSNLAALLCDAAAQAGGAMRAYVGATATTAC